MINQVNYKNKLYKIWKRDPSNLSKKEKFMNYEKSLKRALITAKIQNEYRSLQNLDTKGMWRYVQLKLNQKAKNNLINNITVNGVEITDDRDKAEQFSKFYSNIVGELLNSVQPAQQIIPFPPILMNEKTLFFFPTDEVEISNIIQKLKSKTGGVDGLHADVLKTTAPYIASPLAFIINTALSQGMCPNHFKKAEVCPVYKGGQKRLLTNYRPIALISNLAKVYEKVLFKRIYGFATKNNLISAKQFGFLKGKGTSDAIALLSNNIYNKLAKSTPMAAVFLDYSKAFDTVNHTMLLSKLYNMGIRGTSLSQLQSYLVNRSQVCKVNGVFSNPVLINTGVPQGSILGPLLFILYINDLLDLQEDILSYADDTVVMLSSTTWNELQLRLTQKLDIIYSWLHQNKLILNTGKSMYITFGNYKDSVPEHTSISINNTELLRVGSCKYLGVEYDSHMKWEVHINKTVNRLKYLIYVFARLKQTLSTNQLLQVYYGLFNSVALYGIIGWGGAYDASLNPLIRLQNRILVTIGINENDQKKPLDIKQNFILNSIVYQYSELQTEYLRSTRFNTRNSCISLPKHNLTIGQRSFMYFGMKYFNMLPNNLKKLNCSTKLLKQQLKGFIKTITMY